MITMEQVYKNSNEWLIQQHDLEYQHREIYVVDTKPWYVKLIEYFEEII